MSHLKEQIETSATKLREAWCIVQSPSGISLPSACYVHWTKKASFHQRLSLTTNLFTARDSAWVAVQAVINPENVKDSEQNIITYQADDIDFSIARHLAITSYVTVTWAIYDRLANICGRLSSTEDLSENPKKNPKLCEDFLDGKSKMGFGMQYHLKHTYAWPTKIAYKLRNWLIHEGYEENETELFRGSCPARVGIGLLRWPEYVDHH